MGITRGSTEPMTAATTKDSAVPSPGPVITRPVGIGGPLARIERAVRTVREGKPLGGELRPRLQDVNFGCPWPLRESPHLESARAHALAWMVEMGLTADPEANEEQFRDWKLGECAAWMFPSGTAEGVALAADLMGWYFAPFDDQFDGELGKNPANAAKIIEDLLEILHLPEGAPLRAQYPVAVAFADLWWRSCRQMSSAWRQRAAHHWKQYLVGQLAEVVNRRHRRKLDADSHLRQRAATTSVRVLFDLIESTAGFELSDRAWYMPVLDEIRQLNVEIVSIRNDLVSAEKEEAAGDLDNNLLLILEHQEGYSRLEAVDELRRMTHERFARVLELETHVGKMDDVLFPKERFALRRYMQGLHDMNAGDDEWEHTSGRYVVKEPAAPQTEPGFLRGPTGLGTSGLRFVLAATPRDEG